MTPATAREAAFCMLQHVFRDENFLSDVFSGESARLDVRDRAFSWKIASGVLEKKPALDAVISACSSSPLRKLKSKVLLILEIGAYELLFLDTASYASVNEAVSLTKKAGFSGLSGFVNAVLRRIAKDGAEMLQNLDPWTKAGITETLRKLYSGWYGEKRGLLIAQIMSESERRTVIRRCRSFCSEQEFLEALDKSRVECEKTGLTADTYYVAGEFSEIFPAGFLKGFFYVQDLSSCMAAEAVRDLEPKKVLDVSSAPGGKLLQVLDTHPGYEEAVACDISEKRTDLIRENLRRMPYPNVSVREADASVYFPEYEKRFDLVIADLPCSGLGTLAKNPELRYRTTPESLAEIADLQKKILENVRRYVSPGGTLLYSTCTVNPEENGIQVSGFINKHPEFRLQAFTENLPDSLRSMEAGSGELQILPDVFPGSGFYIARIERTV